MDLQIVFYIILGVIWLVLRVAGKNNKKKPPVTRQSQQAQQSRQPSRNRTSTSRSAEQPKSFEELLRELGQEPRQEPKQGAEFYPEEDLEPIAQAMDGYDAEADSRAQSLFEEAQEAATRVSDMEEAEDLEKTLERVRQKNRTDGRYEEFALEQRKENYYANLLQNPQGFRDAIVVNAILNRPYDDGMPLGLGSREE